MRPKYYLLLALVVGWDSQVRAESPCTEAHTLLRGEVSPCDGDLLPTEKLEKLLNTQTALELAKKQLAELELQAADELAACETNLELQTELRRQCETTVPVAPPRVETPLTSKPWFVATVSVVATSLVFLLAQELAK